MVLFVLRKLIFQTRMCANSEGSGETARIHMLVWAFAGRLCDKYHNLISWLNSSRLLSFPEHRQSSGHQGWCCNNTSPPFPVFRCQQSIPKPRNCPFFDVIFLSLLLFISLSCSFHSPLQNCLRYARGSWDLSFRFFTIARGQLHSESSFVTWSVGSVPNSTIASYLKGSGYSFGFCCQGPAVTGIKEGTCR